MAKLTQGVTFINIQRAVFLSQQISTDLKTSLRQVYGIKVENKFIWVTDKGGHSWVVVKLSAREFERIKAAHKHVDEIDLMVWYFLSKLYAIDRSWRK